ncbi:MAG: membrane dipeptidase [Tissierellia bacterium]|nr:membrane dipeptidase [Tissierellia bacterium]
MMIFDGHGDIWTDVAQRRKKGHRNIIKNVHLDRFKKGNMLGGIFIIWIDPDNDIDPRTQTLEIIEYMGTEIMENQDILKIVKSTEDFNAALEEDKLAVIIGMEGLSGIGDNVDLINTLYLLGVRHVSLTWNEENPLATGVKGNTNRGLSKKGIEAVQLMEKLGIIVDTAHANDKTFWDIYENTTGPIINSHSNARALCNVPRNITDDQIKAIAERGGLIGLNTFNEFVHIDKDKRDINNLANHLDYLVELVGIDHVGFGFDFFDYLEEDSMESFVEDKKTLSAKGIETIVKVPELIDILYNRGYSKEDIDKISYRNFYRIIEEVL